MELTSLHQKWTGARHSYFNSQGLASCGNFFEGPISERCVEFAEYDSNLYCLANLISSRSSNGGFKLELIKDAVPGCVLAIAHAEVKSDLDGELDILPSSHLTNLPPSLSKDACLWTLLEGSMRRGFPIIPWENFPMLPSLANKGWKTILTCGLPGRRLKIPTLVRWPPPKNLGNSALKPAHFWAQQNPDWQTTRPYSQLS